MARTDIHSIYTSYRGSQGEILLLGRFAEHSSTAPTLVGSLLLATLMADVWLPDNRLIKHQSADSASATAYESKGTGIVSVKRPLCLSTYR